MQHLLVLRIHLCDFLPLIIPHSIRLVDIRPDQLIFGMRDLIQKKLFFIKLRIDLKTFTNIFHQLLLVIRIINRKIRIKPDPVNKSPQNPHTSRMERRHPDTFRPIPDKIVNPLPHFPCCFICKRNRHNMIRINTLFFY